MLFAGAAGVLPLSASHMGPIRVGIVSLVDCVPLVAAEHFRLFEKHGLPSVHLHRELGWASVRDKLAFGELDAAQTLGAFPLAAAFGVGGASQGGGAATLMLNAHGNAITLSQRLREAGVRDMQDFRCYARALPPARRLVFGIVFSTSSHHFLLRQWLREVGLNPDKDVRIVVVPPQQMFRNLQAGTIDGFCAGEPWNTFAVSAGVGWCPAVSAQLARGHPEKALVCSDRFLHQRSSEAVSLTAAVLEACVMCDDPQVRRELVPLLAARHRLNCPPEAIEASLLNRFDDGTGVTLDCENFHRFSGEDVNAPAAAHAQWFFDGLLEAGLIDRFTDLDSAVRERCYRMDIFAEAEAAVTALR